MKKQTRKLTFVTMLLLFLITVSSTVLAADKTIYKAVSLKPKKTITTKEYDYSYNRNTNVSTYTYYRYKITAPSEGYLTVKMQKGTDSSSYRSLRMYRALSASDEVGYWGKEASSATYKIAVSKGTYYFKTHAGQKMSYTFTKVSQQPNYAPAKAIPLKAGKKIVVAQTPSYHYSRFYKITLPKKKAITFWFDKGNEYSYNDYVTILDSRFRRIELEHAASDSPKWFTKAQPKGTYYIVIKPTGYSTSDSSLYSYYCYAGTFYWK